MVLMHLCFSAHVPILGVDIWEHVRVGWHGCDAFLLMVVFAGVLSPGTFERARIERI